MKRVLVYTKTGQQKIDRPLSPEPESLTFLRYCRAKGMDPDPEDYDLVHAYIQWVLRIQELGEL